MKYSQTDLSNIKKKADIRNYIPDLKGSGAKRYCKCPECGKSGKDKGLIVTHTSSKDLAKCFYCGFSISGAIAAVMYYNNLDFNDALKIVAKDVGVNLEEDFEREKRLLNESKRISYENSFCRKQLESSGLSEKDVMSKVENDKGEIIHVSPFIKGILESDGKINTNGDEMLIQYFDLWGKPVKYASRGAAGGIRPYIRTRWNNPDLHIYKGKPIKYQSPKNAPVKFYIPEKIREMFHSRTPIDTLIIQEGEKKAEKACKHGIPSIGIQGIYNIGNAEEGLISDLQYLVDRCKIKNIALLMDSDWNHLSEHIENGDSVNSRPSQFAGAVIKFKKYVQSLYTIGLHFDVWWGHIKENESGDKGIDDLLVNTLGKSESRLSEDINTVMLSHNGIGEFVNLYKITSYTDYKILDFWKLNNCQEFCEAYKDRINQLTSFRFNRVFYKNIDGNIVQGSLMSGDKDFWEVNEDEKGKKKVIFSFKGALDFLDYNGFVAIKTKDMADGLSGLYKIENNIIERVYIDDIRNFIYQYVLQTTKNKLVIETFIEKTASWINIDRMAFLRKVSDERYSSDFDYQLFFWKNGIQTKVSSDSIEISNISRSIWKSENIGHNFERIKIFDSFRYDKVSGKFTYRLTPNGKRCEFLQYLLNTSTPYGCDRETADETTRAYISSQLVNKLTSLGFLLHDYKCRTELKAVVAMDGAESEIGQSNGRTGKSLFGVAISYLKNQCTIDGRKLKNDDEFVYNSVSYETRNIFYDDIRVNFDFGQLYPAVTGPLNVNPKGKSRFEIPVSESPKIFLSTNHALKDYDDSAEARINFIEFSNWYSSKRTPIMDFGHGFFEEGWDREQWQLFYNCAIECVQIYLRSKAEEWYMKGCGMIPPPMESIKRRILHQEIGEAFLQWAQAYFDADGFNVNRRIPRKELFDTFQRDYPGNGKVVTAANFRKKLEKFCEYSGFHFNPFKPSRYTGASIDVEDKCFIGGPDKSNSVEYFTVADNDYAHGKKKGNDDFFINKDDEERAF